VGLRRLDQQPMALPHLHTLALRYVKLGGDFAEQSWQSPGAQHLLQAMLQTAATLVVQAVVTDSVNAQTMRMLLAHDVLTPAI
jgi:EAL domain-containing protein (putative c-di-GMP-specific phosphodiesterase class I)